MKSITSIHNPIIQHFLKLKKEAAYRHSEKRVLLEGINAIYDFAKQRTIHRLITTDQKYIHQIKAEEYLIVTDQVMKKISAVLSPQDAIAEVSIPQFSSLTGSKIIACDQISDPGNLGTIIRTALALGWDGLFLLPNSCDPFNDKVIRSSKGACFLLPLYQGSWEELIALQTKHNLHCLVADTNGISPEEFHNEPSVLLIIGNEAKGPNPPQKLIYDRVSIPMKNSMESLNAAIASGILLYELGKKYILPVSKQIGGKK